jgi:hypothetical protein
MVFQSYTDRERKGKHSTSPGGSGNYRYKTDNLDHKMQKMIGENQGDYVLKTLNDDNYIHAQRNHGIPNPNYSKSINGKNSIAKISYHHLMADKKMLNSNKQPQFSEIPNQNVIVTTNIKSGSNGFSNFRSRTEFQSTDYKPDYDYFSDARERASFQRSLMEGIHMNSGLPTTDHTLSATTELSKIKRRKDDHDMRHYSPPINRNSYDKMAYFQNSRNNNGNTIRTIDPQEHFHDSPTLRKLSLDYRKSTDLDNFSHNTHNSRPVRNSYNSLTYKVPLNYNMPSPSKHITGTNNYEEPPKLQNNAISNHVSVMLNSEGKKYSKANTLNLKDATSLQPHSFLYSSNQNGSKNSSEIKEEKAKHMQKTSFLNQIKASAHYMDMDCSMGAHRNLPNNQLNMNPPTNIHNMHNINTMNNLNNNMKILMTQNEIENGNTSTPSKGMGKYGNGATQNNKYTQEMKSLPAYRPPLPKYMHESQSSADTRPAQKRTQLISKSLLHTRIDQPSHSYKSLQKEHSSLQQSPVSPHLQQRNNSQHLPNNNHLNKSPSFSHIHNHH